MFIEDVSHVRWASPVGRQFSFVGRDIKALQLCISKSGRRGLFILCTGRTYECNCLLLLNKSSSHLIILQSLSPQPFTHAFWSVCVCVEKRVTFNFLLWDECLTEGQLSWLTLIWDCGSVWARDREREHGERKPFTFNKHHAFHTYTGRIFQIHNSWYFFLGVSQRIRMLFIWDYTASARGKLMTAFSAHLNFKHRQLRVSRFYAPIQGEIT